DFVLELVIGPRRAYAVQVAGQRADVGRDRHLVIVQQDDHLRFEVADLIDALKRHPCGQPGVADEGDDVKVFALEVARRRDAERRRDRRAGVRRVEDIVFRLFAAQEAAQAVVLAYGRELVAPPRDDLVRVSLVTDVEDQPVARRVEGVMQGEYQFDRAEARAGVAADL